MVVSAPMSTLALVTAGGTAPAVLGFTLAGAASTVTGSYVYSAVCNTSPVACASVVVTEVTVAGFICYRYIVPRVLLCGLVACTCAAARPLGAAVVSIAGSSGRARLNLSPRQPADAGPEKLKTG